MNTGTFYPNTRQVKYHDAELGDVFLIQEETRFRPHKSVEIWAYVRGGGAFQLFGKLEEYINCIPEKEFQSWKTPKEERIFVLTNN